VKKVWLDDCRDPKNFSRLDYVWVKTVQECIEAFKTGDVIYASLDHDLGFDLTPDGEDMTSCLTGYDFICWLEQNPEFWPTAGVAVHSSNPARSS
jgi:hypothetical protein